MRYLLTIIAGIAVSIAWSTMWDLLLGLPMTFFPKEKEIRERQIGMGQLGWILTVGVLRSGLAFGLAVVTFDLLLDHRPHPHEAVKFVLTSLSFGLFSGGASWVVQGNTSSVSPESSSSPNVK